MDLLIAGGNADPNVLRLMATATALGVTFGTAWAGVDTLTWRLGHPGVSVNGVKHNPKSLFARFNVFGYDVQADTDSWWKYHNWHTALCDSLHESNTLNPMEPASSKVRNLRLASDCGFAVPETAVCSISPLDGICKPLHGGDHTKRITRGSACPWGLGFCQEYLSGPEYRIYVVGEKAWAFAMQSDSLDYRENQDVIVSPVTGLDEEVRKTKRVMQRLCLQFASVDLRRGDGAVRFLEINDGPMFVAFDDVVNREISEAMISLLCPPEDSNATEV
jgi:hypothetical protein